MINTCTSPIAPGSCCVVGSTTSMTEPRSPHLFATDVAVDSQLQKTSVSLPYLAMSCPVPHLAVPCPAPQLDVQKQFLDGFQDCAMEVIRFLVEEENVEDNNPLLVGLQSHLTNISQVIRQENQPVLHSPVNFVNRTETGCRHVTPDTRETVSHYHTWPVSRVPRSTNSSVSDSSVSDISMSLSTEGCQRVSCCQELSLNSTSLDMSDDNLLESHTSDDVFHSFSPQHPIPTQSSVLPLHILSQNALPAVQTEADRLSDHFIQYILPVNHSSPILKQSGYSPSVSSFNIQQNFCCFSSNDLQAHHCPPVSPLNESANRNRQLSLDLSTQPEYTGDTETTKELSCFVGPAKTSTEEKPSIPFVDDSQLPLGVLDLAASFLSQNEALSLSSDNLADVLLAVESCRLHHDPRVRTLAAELLHLIQNKDCTDDEEFDDDEDDDEDDDDESMNDMSHEAQSESGIGLSEDSPEWSGATDMIEQ